VKLNLSRSSSIDELDIKNSDLLKVKVGEPKKEKVIWARKNRKALKMCATKNVMIAVRKK